MSEGKYLLVKGIAGLGNRILAVLTGILYARLTGRTLIIDWRDGVYSNDGSNVFHRYFQSPLVIPGDKIPVTDSVRPDIWRGRIVESVEHLRKPFGNTREFWQMSSIDMSILDYTEDVLVMWTYIDKVELLRKHFKKGLSKFERAGRKEILSTLLREDLMLDPRIRDRVARFKRDSFLGKTIGVHVRYADHRAKIKSILDKLRALMELEPQVQIFLATDNLNVKKLFEETHHRVITTDHWFPAPGARMHENPGCPDRLENGIEALVDLYLLAECDYLIVDTSSMFSYIAVLLTRCTDSRIINVNPVERGGKGYTLYRRILWRLLLKLKLYAWIYKPSE